MMVWNPKPEVTVARDAAKKLKAEIGCVVLWFNRETVGMASYGHNVRLCDEMGKLGDHLLKAAKDYYAEAE